jgi:hypothetical protein
MMTKIRHIYYKTNNYVSETIKMRDFITGDNDTY